MTYVLGIESSANKVGIGIVDSEGNILSNPRATYCAPTGQGFLPKETANHHTDSILTILEQATTQAKLNMNQISAIAFTKGPGMGAPLQVGAIVARTLSIMFNIPILCVNHCIAHIEMGRLVTGVTNPIVLYVSGGNTQIICFSDGYYRIFGETIDIAVGNLLDRFARILSISNAPSPGYNIEQLAKQCTDTNSDNVKQLLTLIPYSVKGMDVSFSGILTKMTEIATTNKTNKNINKKYSDAELCFALQEIIFSMLIEVTERAMSHCACSDVLIVGGVGCNVHLQKMMKLMTKDRGGQVCCMDDRFCVDNGAMIAWTGMLQLNKKKIDQLDQTQITQRFRTDEVPIIWR